jgi:hypothetical protein
MKRTLSLKVDWPNLITNLTNAAAQGFLTAFGGDGISNGIAALVNATGTIGIENDPGEDAWRLFWLSFAWTLDELRSTHKFDDARLRIVVHDALEAARKRTDARQEIVPLKFLTRPVTLPLYCVVRDEFVERRAEFRLTGMERAEELSARFDSAFSRAVSEIWLQRRSAFKSLAELIEVPFDRAGTRELEWAAYRQRLVHEFEVKPMFGQEEGRISLAHAYVPLRCLWRQKSDDVEEINKKIDNIRYLDELIMEWVNVSKASLDADVSTIKLIGGGPGSGKSTSMRRLARVMAERADIRPLFIPLQHIDLEGGLRESINLYFTSRTRGPFTIPPLSREALEDGPRLLLIFDGLDEIARPGEGANEVAGLFVSKLNQLQSSLQGDTEIAPKIIVTGRMPSFQAAKKFRGAMGDDALEVLGYAPINRDLSEQNTIAELDQRPIWWHKYAPIVGFNLDIPLALLDKRLGDVTNEPLLCYLLVLSGFAIDNWEAAAENRNLIYQRLIDEVWRRGWGDAQKQKDRQGPGRHLSKDSFNDLMETIALAAWLGGDTRIATEDSFLSALKLTHAENAWEEFKSDGGEDVANLAMNFYLKATESAHKGFEFTHKSFGDYLAARAIIKLAMDVVALVNRYIDQAMQIWVKGTGTGTLTHEILSYMKDQIRLEVNKNSDSRMRIENLFSSFQIIVSTVLEEGLPAHSLQQPNWRAAARAQRNSEIMLWSILNACVVNIQDGSAPRRISVGFDKYNLRLKNLIIRIVIGEEYDPPAGKCLAFLEAQNSDLFALDLCHADFSGSNLSAASFNGCHLMNSNLSNCQLDGARMQRASLDHCNFDGSSLNGLVLADARIQFCDIFSQTTGNIILSRRSLLDFPLRTNIPEGRILCSRVFEDDDDWMDLAKKAQALFKDLSENKQ